MKINLYYFNKMYNKDYYLKNKEYIIQRNLQNYHEFYQEKYKKNYLENKTYYSYLNREYYEKNKNDIFYKKMRKHIDTNIYIINEPVKLYFD